MPDLDHFASLLSVKRDDVIIALLCAALIAILKHGWKWVKSGYKLVVERIKKGYVKARNDDVRRAYIDMWRISKNEDFRRFMTYEEEHHFRRSAAFLFTYFVSWGLWSVLAYLLYYLRLSAFEYKFIRGPTMGVSIYFLGQTVVHLAAYFHVAGLNRNALKLRRNFTRSASLFQNDPPAKNSKSQ